MKVKRVLLRIVTVAIFVSCSTSVGWAGLINVAWDGSQYAKDAMVTDSYSALTPDIINVKALMGTNAEGGVDWLFYDGNVQAWTNYRNISGNLAQYNDVTSARGSGVNMLAARDGKLENIYWYGSWFDVWEVSDTTYTSLATDLVFTNNYYATSSNGLVNVHYYNGWHEDVMNTNVYTEVSPFAQSKVYAIGDGRLDTVYFGNGWEYDNINTNTYSSVAANVGTSLLGDMLAARNGSLDWVYDNGSGWETVSISTDTFVDIIWNGTDLFYGAKACGGLYEIAYDGSDWSFTLIDSLSYSVLSTTEIEGSKEIYANVPEPATMAFLMLGGLVSVIRRRK